MGIALTPLEEKIKNLVFEHIIECSYMSGTSHGPQLTSWLLLLSVPIGSMIVQNGALVLALGPWAVLAWAMVVAFLLLWLMLTLHEACYEE